MPDARGSVVALGTTGPLDVDVRASQSHKSTSRALVLRAALWGKGELAATRKISGQEKLSLLAEEMMRTAVRTPFRMEELLKIAESQLGVHLDEISNLKDPEFFYSDLLATVDSRIESVPDKNGKRNPPLHDPQWVASVVGTRIHNVYTLAGLWRIIRNALRDLQTLGVGDANVRGKLRSDEKTRAQYFLLYDTVTTLARLEQQLIATVAAATPHYASYFIQKHKGSSGETELEFDQRGNNRRKIREAHRSYIDAVILELVLPDSQYPPHVLMSCLHDSVEEYRKEEKRFTQALWDAIGDLSVTSQVLEMLESPLLDPEVGSWIHGTVHLSEQFRQFLAVQRMSAHACTMVDLWKISLSPPLTDLRKAHVLSQLWNNINKSYLQVSGVDIDTLWSLQGDLNRAPQWSTHYADGLGSEAGSDHQSRALTLRKISKQDADRNTTKQIALEAEDETDYAAMPGLTSSSDSSDDNNYAGFGKDKYEGDSESEYDPEEDEWLQDMLQDALDATLNIDDLPGSLNFDANEEKGLDNPFKRMFARLKDRAFSANPVLKVNEQNWTPFNPRFRGTPLSTTYTAQTAGLNAVRPELLDVPGIAPRPSPAPLRDKSTPVQENPTGKPPPQVAGEDEEHLAPLDGASPRNNDKPRVGTVKEEDNANEQKKKKKKKRTKKSLDASTSPGTSPKSTVPSHGNLSTEASGSTVKQGSEKSSVNGLVDTTPANSSRTSLPFAQETATAQSSRSYLEAENLATEKVKVKSRPAFAGSFFRSDKERKRPHRGEERDAKGFLGNVLHLPKRAGDLFSRLIKPADGKTHAKKPMKWDDFVKLMRLMGFSYDPSTAGSSVRFDPPNPMDPSITFHKPHPDPTLQRGHLRDFGKRLKRVYGWTPEQFNL